MTTDIEPRLRRGLASYAASAHAVSPPMEELLTRFPEAPRRRRRTTWIVVPAAVATVLAGGAAIASSVMPRDVDRQFTEFDGWSKQYHLDLSKITLAAQTTGPDAARAQLWVAPMRDGGSCEAWRLQHPGSTRWSFLGGACTQGDTPVGATGNDLSNGLFLVSGYAPAGTTRVSLSANGSPIRSVTVPTNRRYLVLLDAQHIKEGTLTITALDPTGRILDTTRI